MPFLPLLKSSRRPLPDQVYQFQVTKVTPGLDVRHVSARASAELGVRWSSRRTSSRHGRALTDASSPAGGRTTAPDLVDRRVLGTDAACYAWLSPSMEEHSCRTSP